ncbi:RNA-directed DNA polymerase [Ruegeria sp. HKCCSP346]|uniref:RNA-directed DNA polymerase n=1 Tax=Ruegeria sp. HKCCSP346 TaxID=2794830 RepID=UPI001AE790A9|nr:RNA-directed DNA polymerase [Ruegeria sp. HKCCSP346]
MKWSSGKMTISDSDYGAVASWKRFQKQVLKFSRENKYVVVTDVANFYDFINFKHLRNIVASICDVEEALLDLLIHLLNELAWVPDYMPRQEMGMPQIETEAPRVLANAMLFELDRVVEKHSYRNYARFMDDIDFGVRTIVEAKTVVRDIDLTLQARQLRLNSAKTKILTQQDAFKHFCVKENGDLDRYARLIELTASFSTLKPRIGQSVLRVYEKWLNRTPKGGPSKSSPFSQGNGSKIHKRTFTLLRKCEVQPPVDDLVWLVRNSPGMRSSAFRTLVHTNRPNDAFNKLLRILKAGVFVDDVAYIEFANFCVHAKLKKTTKLNNGIQEAVGFMKQRGMIGAYAATLLFGRHGTPDQILSHAKELLPMWKGDYWLGRTFAGLYPRLHGAGGTTGIEYLQLLRSTDNNACQSVLDYHFALIHDVAFVKQCSNYLKNDNFSFPSKLYFPKALQILSVRHNTAASKTYAAIKSKHAALTKDPFFKTWGF